MHLSPITAHPGFLNRDELVAHYVALAGVDASALPWYEALALWKASIFSEEIYTRWLKGEKQAATSLGPALEKGVPQLLETAAAFAAQL
jgi:aminoglycoside phosphotransferase (APT) family kinase protein